MKKPLITEPKAASEQSEYKEISYNIHGQRASIRRVVMGGYTVRHYKKVQAVPKQVHFLILVGPYRDTALSLRQARVSAELLARRLFKEQLK